MPRALRFQSLASLSLFAFAACTSNSDERPAVQSIASALVTTGSLEADTYASSGAPTSNFGTATTVRSDSDDAGSIYHGYVRFTIGNVGTITSAKLRVWV